MVPFLRATCAAAALAFVVAPAAATSVPTAADFSVVATPGAPGYFSVTNNSPDWYIYELSVPHDPSEGSNPSTTNPNWLAVDDGFYNNSDFRYYLQAFVLAHTIVPGATESDFFFLGPQFGVHDYTIRLISALNETATVDGRTLSPTPIPGALPLFASGAAVFGLLMKRRKAKRAA